MAPAQARAAAARRRPPSFAVAVWDPRIRVVGGCPPVHSRCPRFTSSGTRLPIAPGERGMGARRTRNSARRTRNSARRTRDYCPENAGSVPGERGIIRGFVYIPVFPGY